MSDYSYNLGLRFEVIASQYAELDALVYPDGKSVTYGELDGFSNQLGRVLCQHGLTNGDILLLSGDKSPTMFATILAALKCGFTYCIYDSEGPASRLKRIISVCHPKIIISSPQDIESRQEDQESIAVLSYDELSKSAVSQKSNPQMETASVVGNQLAYIMFTSGSTGIPKGAMMTHTNVLTLIDWSLKTFNFRPGEILTNVNPSYFDNFVFDFYSALFTGAALAPFTRDQIVNPKVLVETIDLLGCTTWFSVPSMLLFLQNMRALTPDNMSSIRRIIFGGEGYPKVKLVELFEFYKNRIQFFNVYGPTECTCICSCYEVTERDFDSLDGFLPLGSMIPNFGYHIMDERLGKVQLGERGELCLWGPAVGRGYCNDRKRSEGAFVLDPTISNYNRVMYRTGDIVYQDTSDNKIYILGRYDNQIKHMGHRIELEEVENGLMELPYISQACCVHGNINGLSKLIGVVEKKEEITPLQIAEDLKSYLPKYMIPGQFYILNSLPKNANGKIDRMKLKSLYFELK